MASLMDVLVEQGLKRLTKKEAGDFEDQLYRRSLGGPPPTPPIRGPLTPQEMADFETQSLQRSRSRGAGEGRTVTPQEAADFESQSLNRQWSTAPTPPNPVVLNRGSQFVGPRTATGLISEVAGETPEQLARRAEVEGLYAARTAADKPYDSYKGAVGATAAGVGIGAGLLGIDSMGPRADLSSPVLPSAGGPDQPQMSPVPVDLSTPEGLRAEITRKKDQLSRDTGKSISDLEKQTKEAITSTIPEGQKTDFLKSIEGLDLLNFSMAMLANNNGEMNPGQVLGLAFQAALKQKEGRDQLGVENKIKDRAAASEEERAAAATSGAGAAVLNAETNAKYTPVEMSILQQNADSEAFRAQASMVAAAQGTTGSLRDAGMLVGKPINSTQMSEAQMYLGEVLGAGYKLKLGDKGRVGDIALVDATAQAIAAERNYRTANRIPQPFTREDALAIAQKVAEPVIAAGVTTDGPGWGTTYIEPSMLSPGGYTAANPGPRVTQPTVQSAKAARLAEIERQLSGQ